MSWQVSANNLKSCPCVLQTFTVVKARDITPTPETSNNLGEINVGGQQLAQLIPN